MKEKMNITKEDLLKTLQDRFDKNMNRHKGLVWDKVLKKIESNKEGLLSLVKMEASGGEPDVVGYDKKLNEYIFYDCSKETPMDRRNYCYDREAWESRKSFKPKDNAVDVAKEMGIELLTEEEYLELQKLGNFDTKTSSWIKTPTDIRNLGGALFGDYRFGRVFFYHNGAESYYSSRGFRGKLNI